MQPVSLEESEDVIFFLQPAKTELKGMPARIYGCDLVSEKLCSMIALDFSRWELCNSSRPVVHTVEEAATSLRQPNPPLTPRVKSSGSPEVFNRDIFERQTAAACHTNTLTAHLKPQSLRHKLQCLKICHSLLASKLSLAFAGKCRYCLEKWKVRPPHCLKQWIKTQGGVGGKVEVLH